MDIITFMGRLHPLVVHLPIGILLLAGVFYVLARIPRFSFLEKALPMTLLIGALSAAGAALFGWLLSLGSNYDETTLFWHKWLGIGVALLSAFAFWWTTGPRKTPVVLLGLIVVVLSITGHLGGNLTHGADYLTQPLFGDEEVAARELPDSPDSILLYADLIHPVFEQKCLACHNETKQNGGLNMATWEDLEKGGSGGSVIGHHVWDSELLRRVRLSQSNSKFMPPKGEAMTFGEMQLLKWWLENGAPQDASLAALKMNDEIKEVLLHEFEIDLSPKDYIEKVSIEPLAETAFLALRKAGWDAQALAQTNHLIEVRPKGEDPITPAQMAALQEAKEHITWLHLGNTNIRDEDLQTISQFPNLTRLRLENTQITDQGLLYLLELQHLESLNLFGNAITDTGLGHLEKMASLKRIYLWQTETTDAGRESLQTNSPDLQLL